jgi:hypothetical protein
VTDDDAVESVVAGHGDEDMAATHYATARDAGVT